MKRFAMALATAGVKRPWLVIAIIALISVAALSGALRVEMEFSQKSLMPEGYESIVTIKQVEEDFGGLQYDKVLLTGTDFTSYEAALAIYGYGMELRARHDPALWEEYVLGVESYLGQLTRNPQAAPLFRLAYAVEESRTSEEFSSAAEEFLSDPETAALRDYAEAPPSSNYWRARSIPGTHCTLSSWSRTCWARRSSRLSRDTWQIPPRQASCWEGP